ncbi:MAG: putative Ig domain-containing protein [Bacteroidales bacterium]|nr:putative Ig domain-containing protein [Bacteroidales bacterium]
MEKVLLETLDSIGASAGSPAAPDSGGMYILTPKAPDTPRVNGPKVYGARPGAEFLYRIPATGLRPMRFSAEGLPRGLKLDAETGIITGKVKKAGTWKVTLTARNDLGSATRDLKIVIGDKICLTPPLGWNSWNAWGNSVTQEQVEAAARAMEERGLADCGWTYINIDDGWQGVRGGKYNAIQPNGKFPDMKALADVVHARGLKLGIYSGPWVGTYAGHIGSSSDYADGSYDVIRNGLVDEFFKIDRSKADRGSVRYFGKYSFAAADARQWADWGVDYLKYDWYPNDVPHVREMAEALRATGRDIVYSLSNTAPFAYASSWEELSQAWRTTNDIRDTWESMSGIGFRGQARWARYCGPGHWPDADMLVVGKVGWGPTVHPSRLTADEQYTHISLWALLSSPMLLGCDMASLDDFTVSLLTNTEVLDVNQDPLGVQAAALEQDDSHAIYVKPLEDGSMAVGLFNLGSSPRQVGFSPRALGLSGKQTVRDIWRQRDLGTVEGKTVWSSPVPAHGVVFLKLTARE